MVEIASLDEVPLREVWRDEARDFTSWLAVHPDRLGKALQMDLELEGAEVAVGPFFVDVVLRDANTGQRAHVVGIAQQRGVRVPGRVDDWLTGRLLQQAARGCSSVAGRSAIVSSTSALGGL